MCRYPLDSRWLLSSVTDFPRENKNIDLRDPLFFSFYCAGGTFGFQKYFLFLDTSRFTQRRSQIIASPRQSWFPKMISLFYSNFVRRALSESHQFSPSRVSAVFFHFQLNFWLSSLQHSYPDHSVKYIWYRYCAKILSFFFSFMIYNYFSTFCVSTSFCND